MKSIKVVDDVRIRAKIILVSFEVIKNINMSLKKVEESRIKI
jgi:hypothetical protein